MTFDVPPYIVFPNLAGNPGVGSSANPAAGTSAPGRRGPAPTTEDNT